MKSHTFFSTILIIRCLTSFAQDIHFSQFQMVPTLVNPANAGRFNGNARAILNYRSQWMSVLENPYVTYGGMVDGIISKKSGKQNYLGAALNVYADKAGSTQMGTTVADVNLAYHLKANENIVLSAGIQAGIIQRSITMDKLRFENQFDGSAHNPNLPSNENFSNQQLLKPDVAAGMYFQYSNEDFNRTISNNGYAGKMIGIGLSVRHINSPNYSFIDNTSDRLNLKYVFTLFSSFGINNTNIAVQPMGYFAYQKAAYDYMPGLLFRYALREQSKFTGLVKGAAFSLGGYYRIQDAFIPTVLIEMGSIALGLSYDLTTSTLSANNHARGGLEISLRYVNPNPFNPKSQARFY